MFNKLTLIHYDDIAYINVDRNPSYLKDIVISLCMMSVILTLNGGNPTTFRYLLNEVLDDIKQDVSTSKINANSAWQINLVDFIEKLGDSTISRNIKKALLIMDVICCNTSGTINIEKINLEHIYPQNPKPEWAQNGWPSSKEKQKPLIDNIGNYLLLSEPVNKSVQNKYITEKAPKYHSIIEKDKILQTTMNTVDFSKFKDNQKNYIYKRQKEIAKLIQNNLPLGKVLIKN